MNLFGAIKGAVAVFGLLGAIEASDRAGATTLTDLAPYDASASISVTAGGAPQSYNLSGIGTNTAQASGVDNSTARVSESIALTPTPTIILSGTVGVGTDGSATAYASATLTYSFEIVGPSGLVPLHIVGLGTDNSLNGQAELVINNRLDQVGNINVALANGAENWTLNTTTNFEANVQYYVNMEADEVVSCGGLEGSCSGSFIVYNDPSINISPTFADANQYSIVFSPGVAATPLPAALPLFATGLGALGLLGWRYRSRLSPIPTPSMSMPSDGQPS
jgi:hypothetical protein